MMDSDDRNDRHKRAMAKQKAAVDAGIAAAVSLNDESRVIQFLEVMQVFLQVMIRSWRFCSSNWRLWFQAIIQYTTTCRYIAALAAKNCCRSKRTQLIVVTFRFFLS